MNLEGRKQPDGRVLPPAPPFVCPICCENIAVALGGRGGAWFECQCGTSSPLKADWEQAYKAWFEDPKFLSPNVNMYPALGLPKDPV